MKKILLILMIVSFGAMSAMAANNYTRADISISNYGTLSFKVGTEQQDDQNSSTDVFVVDRKVDLVVAHADPSYVIVNPNNKDKFLTFTVRNDGNDIQDYNLTYIVKKGDPWTGSKTTKELENIRIFVDVNADGGGYDAAHDTETYIDQLAPDENRTVFIVVDVPGSAESADIDQFTLVAETRDGNTSGTQGDPLTKENSQADNPATVQNVFADAAGNGEGDSDKDGKHADYDAFKVEAAVITFAKWSIVISDPVEGKKSEGKEPKRIPGALIRYCFDINNSGDKNATNVSWTDDLNDTATKHNALDYNDSITWHQTTQGTCDCTNDSGYSGGSIDSNGVVTMVMEDKDTLTSPIEVNQQACGWIEATIR